MRNQPPHAASNVGRLDSEATWSLFLMDHVCPTCGHDCSTIRTPPDPVYGLPVMVCPGCGLASVRRRVWTGWWRTGPWSASRTAVALALRVLVLAVMTALSVGAVAAGAEIVEHTASRLHQSRASLDEGMGLPVILALALIGGLSLVSAVTLAWIAPHLARWARALIPGVIVALLVWGVPNAASASNWYFRTGTQYRLNRTFTPEPTPFVFDGGSWSWGVALGVLVLLVWALGRPADRFAQYVTQQSWLTRLAKSRRRRQRSRS